MGTGCRLIPLGKDVVVLRTNGLKQGSVDTGFDIQVDTPADVDTEVTKEIGPGRSKGGVDSSVALINILPEVGLDETGPIFVLVEAILTVVVDRLDVIAIIPKRFWKCFVAAECLSMVISLAVSSRV
jgi:hypothetical protein